MLSVVHKSSSSHKAIHIFETVNSGSVASSYGLWTEKWGRSGIGVCCVVRTMCESFVMRAFLVHCFYKMLKEVVNKCATMLNTLWHIVYIFEFVFESISLFIATFRVSYVQFVSINLPEHTTHSTQYEKKQRGQHTETITFRQKMKM